MTQLHQESTNGKAHNGLVVKLTREQIESRIQESATQQTFTGPGDPIWMAGGFLLALGGSRPVMKDKAEAHLSILQALLGCVPLTGPEAVPEATLTVGWVLENAQLKGKLGYFYLGSNSANKPKTAQTYTAKIRKICQAYLKRCEDHTFDGGKFWEDRASATEGGKESDMPRKKAPITIVAPVEVEIQGIPATITLADGATKTFKVPCDSNELTINQVAEIVNSLASRVQKFEQPSEVLDVVEMLVTRAKNRSPRQGLHEQLFPEPSAPK